MGQRPGEGVDQRVVKAIAHPLRVRILEILSHRVASPTQMANLTGEPLGNICYHTTVLRDSGCLQLVKSEPRRGASEQFYRAIPHALRSRDWTIPSPLRGEIVATALETLMSRAMDSLQPGKFQRREGSTVTSMQMAVDEEGWEEIQNILEIVERDLRAVGEISERRLRAVDGIPVLVTVAAFEVGSGGAGCEK